LSEVELTALLVALRCYGEKPDTIAGAAQALLDAAHPFPRPDGPFADVVGTGGDSANTINVSTAVAFVAASAGLPIAKHGNRAISSKCGSADLLERLGVRLELSPESVRRCLDQSGIGFLFAPHYHPGIRHAMPVRKRLGVRTIFNILGPLVNPSRPPIMLLGVYDPGLSRIVAEALKILGCRQALVVHGSGLDEIALHGATSVVKLFEGEISERVIAPSDFGAKEYPLSAIAGGDATENTAHISSLLSGRGLDAHATAVGINAAALLELAGMANNLRDGYQMSRDLIASGSPWQLLEKFAVLSRSLS
jgi:anthranilate phosphoribosyltransferase